MLKSLAPLVLLAVACQPPPPPPHLKPEKDPNGGASLGDGQLPGAIEGEETAIERLTWLASIGLGGETPRTFELAHAKQEGATALFLPDTGTAALLVPWTPEDRVAIDLAFETSEPHAAARTKRVFQAFLATYYASSEEAGEQVYAAPLHDPARTPWVETSGASYGFRYGVTVGGLARFNAQFSAQRTIRHQHLTLVLQDQPERGSPTMILTVPVTIEPAP